MKSFRFSIVLLLGIALVWSTPGAAQPSSVSVTDFGAKGDGITDDTAAFNAALASVAEKGGTVHVPVGNYMIKTHISVPGNVTLEGVWSIPTAFSQMKGSTLLAVENEGSETGPPFISLAINSTIKGITVYYPNQDPDNIKPYPWCIGGTGGDNASIIDCLLVNPYQGVDFATNNSGRHYIRGLYGQPLRRGIAVDKCYDIGRIENVHFWPFWKWEGKIKDYLWEYGEAFIFARTDWEYVFNTFTFGYKIGYRFIASKAGACNGNFLGIGADAANIAVLVEQCQKPGLLITNGEFVAFAGDNPCEVVVKESNTGVVQFSNCSYWGPADQIARIAGQGSVTFTGCSLTDWNRKKNNTAAIEHYGGNLIVNGCNFNDSGPQISLRDKAKSAIVMGNRMGGPKAISNPAKAQLQMGLNVFGEGPKLPKEERGAIVVDDVRDQSCVRFYGKWETAKEPGAYLSSTHWATKGKGESKAVFTPNVTTAGVYNVFVWVGPDSNNDHAANAPVTISGAGLSKTVQVNLKSSDGKWLSVGKFNFPAGKKMTITFNNSADANVIADAVKLVPAK